MNYYAKKKKKVAHLLKLNKFKSPRVIHMSRAVAWIIIQVMFHFPNWYLIYIVYK